MTKFVCKNTFPPVATINHTLLKQNVVNYYQSHLTIKNNLRVEKGHTISKTNTTIPLPEKNAWGTRRDKHTKKSKAIIMLAPCPGRCLLHHTGIENDQTIFFHITAGNVKFAVSQ